MYNTENVYTYVCVCVCVCRVEIEGEIRKQVDELMREELKNLKLVRGKEHLCVGCMCTCTLYIHVCLFA